MKCSAYFAVFATLASCQALAVGSLANIRIIDRDTGTALAPHYFRGEYWVAGTPGARYAIEIRNSTGGRMLAVTSVDGVNVVTGETAGWGQSGYVFAPGERYEITGWRKSEAQVAAFTFTASPDSYAERTGRPANVGVIGVAVFRERLPQPVAVPRIAPPRPVPGQSGTAPSALGKADEASARAQTTSPLTEDVTAPASKAEPKLGTGHGEREYSYVNYTDFQRLQSEPNEVIRIRYDSLDNLVAMGIVRRPHPQPLPGADPFPASPAHAFVPDPPG
jgi:hypothetical protein